MAEDTAGPCQVARGAQLNPSSSEALRISLDTSRVRWLSFLVIPTLMVMLRERWEGLVFGALFGVASSGSMFLLFSTPDVYLLPGSLRVLKDGKERIIPFTSIQEVRETYWRHGQWITFEFDVSKSLSEKIKFIPKLPMDWPFIEQSVAQRLRILAGLKLNPTD